MSIFHWRVQWRFRLIYFWILGHKRIRFHDLPQAWRPPFLSGASLIPGWSGSSRSPSDSVLRTPKPSKTMDSPDREDQKKSLIDLNNRCHAFISESPLKISICRYPHKTTLIFCEREHFFLLMFKRLVSYVEKVRKLQEAADVIDSIPRTAETSVFLSLFCSIPRTAETSVFLILFLLCFHLNGQYFFHSRKLSVSGIVCC